MEKELSIVIAGFGGQGVLFAGLVLAHAAMNAGKNVAWIPSYGPEMRGGTASCTVTVSEDEIGSPISIRPDAAIVMNEPSLAKWGPRVRPGGTLVVNRSLARAPLFRSDLRVLDIPASEIAAGMGSDRVANMVALGALLGATGVLSMDLAEAAMVETPGPGKDCLVAANRDALRRGAELADRQLSPLAA